MATGSPSEVAALVLGLVRQRPATLGAGRLICVDGPGGSGKTTLAAALAAVTGAPIVHMDDLYDGWQGLDRVGTQLDGLLRPLADDRTGAYRRYDWVAQAFAETRTVEPGPLLVVEGVGSGSDGVADLVTVLVWVEAPSPARLARGLARDGEDLREQWLRWQHDEDRHFARHRTRERADLVVDGTGSRPPSLPSTRARDVDGAGR